MRKELYKAICERLELLYMTTGGDHAVVERGADVPEGWERLIRHIDLWNHNVEFIEQEEQWERPAVFVEFPAFRVMPVKVKPVVRGVDYRAEPTVNLHVVTDWSGSCSAGSPFREESLRVFDILESIHSVLFGLEGDTFSRFHLAGCQTNHNHEEIIENIETYQCVAIKSL